jgi:Flp pilus assembly protein TadG
MRAVMHRLRPRSRGQALVESALLAPILLLLLVGGMQVAYLGYGAVSIDTAAREGARVAVEDAQTALSFTSGSTPSSYTCAADPSTDSNPVCQAIANNAGLLKGQKFVLVRIDTNVAVARTMPRDQVPADVVRVGSSCSNQNDAQVSGSISPAMALPVSDTLGDSTTSDGAGSFTLCMKGTGNNSQTVSINVNGTSGGQTCTGTASTTISKSGNKWSASPASVSVTVTCISPSSTSSTTTTSTTTSSITFSTSIDFGSTPAGSPCTQVPAAGTYVTITVEYQASIMVPLLNTLLADPGQGYKTLKSVVTMRVEPCTT